MGWQEIVWLTATLAFCVVPIAAVAFAVLYFREKRRADGLEASLREGGWQGLPPGAWAPPGRPQPLPANPWSGPADASPTTRPGPPMDPPRPG